jgi:hypothetical protein
MRPISKFRPRYIATRAPSSDKCVADRDCLPARVVRPFVHV